MTTIELLAAVFELALRQAPEGEPVTVTETNAVRAVTRGGTTEYAFADDAPVVRVAAHERIDATGARRCRLDVTVAPGWHHEKTAYPLVDVPYPLSGDGTDDRCVVGATVGGVWHPKSIDIGRAVVYPYPGSLAALP